MRIQYPSCIMKEIEMSSARADTGCAYYTACAGKHAKVSNNPGFSLFTQMLYIYNPKNLKKACVILTSRAHTVFRMGFQRYNY